MTPDLSEINVCRSTRLRMCKRLGSVSGRRGQHHGSHEEALNIPTSPQRGRPRQRQVRPPLTSQGHIVGGSPLPSPTPSRSNSREPLYRTTSLETRSRTPSPENVPTPTPGLEYYGSANLTDRSRSPSPSSTAETSRGGKARPARRLPATPQKPSTLNLKATNTLPTPQQNMPHVIPSPTIPQPHKSPGSINFPRLSASPTHRNIQPHHHQQHRGGPPPPEPPGRGMRAFSPTDTNDLNMPGAGRPGLPRQSSRDRPHPHPDHDRGPPPRYPGQILNNTRPEAMYTDRERDNRFRENRLEAEGTTGLQGRPAVGGIIGGGARPTPIVPNGYKPGQGRRPERPPGGRSSADIISAPGASDSDDDDEDWC